MRKLFSCLLLLLPAALAAEDFYVRPGHAGGAHTGADWDNAWNGFAQIQWGAGAAKLGAGDTCWVAGGTYETPLEIGASGTVGNRIVIKRVRATDPVPTAAAGWAGSFDSQVVITAPTHCIGFTNGIGSYVTIDGQIPSGIRVNYSDSGRGVDFDGLVDFTDITLRCIEAAGPGPINQKGDTRGFDLTTQGWLTNITVTHCEAHHSDTLMQVSRSVNLVVEYCELHHSGAVNADTFHPNAIYLSAVTNATICYNRFHDLDVEGIFFGDPGINGVRIYGNLFYQGSSPPDSGRGIEFDNTAPSNGVLVYNNTFASLPLPGVNFTNSQNHTGAVVRNNLFYHTPVEFGLAAHDYNWLSGASEGEPDGIANGANPFVDASTYNYHIVDTVAADLPKDKGIDLGAPYNVDFDGVVRAVDGGWDIGAYESNPFPPSILTQPASLTVMADAPATFTVVATGNAPPNYQWQRGSIAIAGATNASFTIASVAPSDAATYRVTVANGLGTLTSAAATLAVLTEAPAITVQPAGLTVAAGAVATFAVAVTGHPAPSLQWRKGEADIAGATSATYAIPNVAPSDAGSYSVLVSNEVSSVTSEAAILTVPASAPVITGQPANLTVLEGASATFTVRAAGNPMPTFQWQRDDQNLPGATSATYTIASVLPGDVGSFTVVVTNGEGSVTSSAATLTVNSPPAITTQPANLSVTEGDPATFTVVATGTPALTYQWTREDEPIVGATNAAYTIAISTPGDAAHYAVVVGNGFGSITSGAVTLTVNSALVVTDENFYVRPGYTGGAHTGADWNNAWNGFTDIKWGPGLAKLGAGDVLWIAGGTYVLPLQIGASGLADHLIVIKRVRASDAVPTAVAGWDASFDSPVVIATGADISGIYFNNGVGSYVTVDGQIPSGIRVNYIGGSNGVEVDGGVAFTDITLRYIEAAGPGVITETESTRGFDLTTQADLTNITVSHCEAHHACTLLQVSRSTNLIVEHCHLHHASDLNPFQVLPTAIYLGQVTNATIRYNRFHDNQVGGLFFGDPHNVGARIYGNLFFQGAPPPDTRSGIEFDDRADSTNFLVYNNSFVDLGLIGVDFGDGQSHTDAVVQNNLFYNTSVDYGPVTPESVVAHDYNWYSGGNNGEVHGIANGANPFVNVGAYGYHIVDTVAADLPKDKGLNLDAPYDRDLNGVVRAADGGWDIGAYESVPYAPSILTQPIDLTVMADGPVTFTVVATGNAPPGIQWRKEGVDIAGATRATFTIASAAPSDGASYSVVVANNLGTVTSTAAMLTVLTEAPVITGQPSGQTAGVGTPATFTVSATGHPAPAYQWKKDGAAIAGATTASLTITSVTPADDGTYTVVVANEVGTVPSDPAILTVPTSAPVITTPPVGLTVIAGTAAAFTVAANGNPVPTYQWQRNGTDIPDATGATYPIPSASPGDAGSYTVVVTNEVSSVASAAVTLTVHTAPVITTPPASLAVTAGAPASFTVVATGNPAPTYQWLRDNAPLTGATDSTYTIASVSPGHAGGYVVTVTNAIGSATSLPATLTVHTAPEIIAQPAGLTVTAGATASFTVVATGNPAPLYQWRKDGASIAGATDATYTIAQVTADRAGDYRVVVSNSVSSVVSDPAALTVNTAPVITTQPASMTVTEGDSATFTVLVTGNPAPSFQWQRNDEAIPGATAAAYTIASVVLTDAGSFTVIVSNSIGVVTSDAATLTVSPAVTAEHFYVRPGYAGGAHTGTDWNNAWDGFAEITWGTGLGKLGPGDACWIAGGNYSTPLVIGASGLLAHPIALKRVRASDAVPAAAPGWDPSFDSQVVITTATSCVYFNHGLGSYVTLDGQVPSGIRVNYANGSRGVELDGAVNFTDVALRYIEAAGPGPIQETGDTRGFDLTIAGTLTNVTISHCEAHHSDTLVQVSPSVNLVIEYCDLHHAGAVNTNDFHPNIIYLGQVTNATIRYNQLHDIDVEGIFFGSNGINGVKIYGNLFYQGSSTPDSGRGIEFDNSAGSSGVLIYNNTFVNLPRPGVNFRNGTSVHPGAMVQNNLFHNTPVEFGAVAHDYNLYSGEVGGIPADDQGELHGIASGANPFVDVATYGYQIIHTVRVDLPKDKGADLGAPFNLDPDGVVRGADGGWDIGAYESIGIAPSFVSQPASLTVTADASATFTTAATGNPAPTYQWKFDGVDIAEATGTTYTMAHVSPGNAGSYTVVASNAVSSVVSAAATLTVHTAPVIAVQPASVSVTTGDSATFTVAASGNPAPSFQWRRDGAPITGATDTTYTLLSVTAGHAGSYTVAVANTVGSVISDAAILTVPDSAPVITTQSASVTVTTGASATFTVQAIGNPDPSYQWWHENEAIVGATGNSLTLTNVTQADAGGYTAVVSNGVGSAVTSAAATLTVHTAPAITAQPTSLTVTAGAPATFAVTATGNPAPTYQWRKEAFDLLGATDASYTIPGPAPGDAGSYTVVVSNAIGSVTSGAATLTVNTAPTITAQPASLTVTAGASATFSVGAMGSPYPTFQWKKGGLDIAGATGATYTIDDVTSSEAGSYSVEVANVVGFVSSTAAELTVHTAPVFTTEPASLTVPAGSSATFTVTATGNPAPTYQWMKGSAEITGATNDTYTIASVAPADAASYSVVATNEVGAVASAAATLTVNTAPAITTQPANVTASAGSAAAFTVVANSNPAPTYQWKMDDVVIAGATTATYAIPSVVPADAGSYLVVVTNELGSVTSDSATLTVNTAPVITTEPVSLTVTAGAAATFTVVAAGKPAPTYQWRQVGQDIPGATGATYTITNAGAGDAGSYTVAVSNVAGSVTSTAATLTVHTAPAITTQPVSLTVTAGTSASFTVEAAGNPAPTYQWRKGAVDISGATAASYTIPSAAADDAAGYTVVVTNEIGSVTSATAALTVHTAPAIATEPFSLTVTAGSSATFTVVATGNPAPTFQWRKGAVDIPGATGANFPIVEVSALDAGSYTVVVTNEVGFVTSTAASLTVHTAPVIATQPNSSTVTAGTSATFSVVATGNPAPTYQWRKGADDILGATSATYMVANATPGDAASYRVVVTNVVGSVTSDAASLTVHTAPVITSQPTSNTVVAGAAATFTVVATGNPAPTYQWMKGSVDIAGATAASYTITSAAPDNAASYEVVVTNAVASVASDAATLTVHTAPAITTQPANLTVTAGASATFTVVATGNPAPTYQWKKGAGDISGATAASFTIPGAAPGDAASYTVVVTNVVGSVTSDAATLTVHTAPVITSQPANLTVTAGAAATFTVVAAGNPAPSYQWRKGAVDIPGATGITYTITNSASGDAASYTVVVTNLVGSVTSDAAILTVHTAPAITTQPANLTVTAGASATFTVVASGNPAPTYQWKKGTVDISGATAASHTITSAAPSDAAGYTVVVTNEVGSVTSDPATLTVHTAPKITSQPANLTVTAGAFATFTVVATGNPTPTYQWKKGTVDIPGATAASYTITSAVSGDAASYTVVVTNLVGSVTSDAAALAVHTAPVITSQPANLIVTTGASATFTVVATGNPAPTYQWQRLRAAGGTWSNLTEAGSFSGVTGPALTISSVNLGMSGDQFRCIATNSSGSATSSGVTLTVNASLVVPGDLDGDGKSDLVLSNSLTGERALWLMNGTTISAGASLGILPLSWVISATGDFNGDGKSDLVLTSTVSGERVVWLMNGLSIGSGASLGILPTNWTISGAGDFNGDGKADIFLSNATTGERAIWLMNGQTIASGASLGVLPTFWTLSGTGDFNGDGKADIVLTNTATGDRAVWLMNGATISSGAGLGVFPAAWTISGTGDFNGDGKADIVLTNTATGDRAVWLMNGTSINSGAFIGVLPSSWVFSQVGDFNGDGKSDIFLTNTASGDRAIWLMNGIDIAGAKFIGVVATDWLITH